MAFGKHSDGDDVSGPDDINDINDVDDLDGPFDVEDFDDPATAAVARLDLGSVLIPMPEAGQVQVELTEMGVPSAVWVVTPNGRFTIAAYAAPKTPGLWREVASELADSLRNDVAKVSIEDGPWGREVVGVATPEPDQPPGIVRFIGVDGYRWMIRCVVNGPQDKIAALAAEARNALADTVVRRGETPMPVRAPLQPPRLNKISKPANSRLRRNPPRAAASTGRPCSSCAPSPAARHRPARPGTPRPAHRGRRPSRRA